MGCSGDKLYLDNLNTTVLAAVKIEARKTLGNRQKRSQERSFSLRNDTHMEELKRLNAQVVILERRSISLYDDFAERKLDRDAYLEVKLVCAEEIAITKKRIEELTVQIDCAKMKRNVSIDVPISRRILSTEELTEEIVALIGCITVYDVDHIEIRFDFGDANV